MDVIESGDTPQEKRRCCKLGVTTEEIRKEQRAIVPYRASLFFGIFSVVLLMVLIFAPSVLSESHGLLIMSFAALFGAFFLVSLGYGSRHSIKPNRLFYEAHDRDGNHHIHRTFEQYWWEEHCKPMPMLRVRMSARQRHHTVEIAAPAEFPWTIVKTEKMTRALSRITARNSTGDVISGYIGTPRFLSLLSRYDSVNAISEADSEHAATIEKAFEAVQENVDRINECRRQRDELGVGILALIARILRDKEQGRYSKYAAADREELERLIVQFPALEVSQWLGKVRAYAVLKSDPEYEHLDERAWELLEERLQELFSVDRLDRTEKGDAHAEERRRFKQAYARVEQRKYDWINEIADERQQSIEKDPL